MQGRQVEVTFRRVRKLPQSTEEPTEESSRLRTLSTRQEVKNSWGVWRVGDPLLNTLGSFTNLEKAIERHRGLDQITSSFKETDEFHSKKLWEEW